MSNVWLREGSLSSAERLKSELGHMMFSTSDEATPIFSSESQDQRFSSFYPSDPAASRPTLIQVPTGFNMAALSHRADNTTCTQLGVDGVGFPFRGNTSNYGDNATGCQGIIQPQDLFPNRGIASTSEPLTTIDDFIPSISFYGSLDQSTNMGNPSVAEPDSEAWLSQTMAGSFNAFNEFSGSSLQPRTPQELPNNFLHGFAPRNIICSSQSPQKRRMPHGSKSLSRRSPGTKRSKMFGGTFSKITNPSALFRGGERGKVSDADDFVKIQNAITVLEQSVKTFSIFSQRKAASLIGDFKMLVEDERLYGRPDEDFGEVAPTNTGSSSHESFSTDESEYRTDDTSASSAPSHTLPDTQEDTTTVIKPTHKACIQCGVKTLYQCTRSNCGYSVHSFTDWKRHQEGEKHWPQERFMCLQCPASVPSSNLTPSCQFCLTSFQQIAGNPQEHYLQCTSAREKGRTFGRKDHLAEHLRDDHSMTDTNAIAATWKYGISSNWPRQCGFCGDVFQNWDKRMSHIGKHFKKGLDMSSWKLPFHNPKDFKPNGPGFDHRGDSSDDDDDFDDNNDHSTKKHSPKHFTHHNSSQARSNQSSQGDTRLFKTQQSYRKRPGSSSDDALTDTKETSGPTASLDMSQTGCSKFNGSSTDNLKIEIISENEIPLSDGSHELLEQAKIGVSPRKRHSTGTNFVLERYLQDPEEPIVNIMELSNTSQNDTFGNLQVQDKGTPRSKPRCHTNQRPSKELITSNSKISLQLPHCEEKSVRIYPLPRKYASSQSIVSENDVVLRSKSEVYDQRLDKYGRAICPPRKSMDLDPKFLGRADEFSRARGYSKDSIEQREMSELRYSSLLIDGDDRVTKPELRRSLSEYHVNSIAISGCIGIGLFLQAGKLIDVAGPIGILLAYTCVAFMVFNVMASLGEMAILIPRNGCIFDNFSNALLSCIGVVVSWTYKAVRIASNAACLLAFIYLCTIALAKEGWTDTNNSNGQFMQMESSLVTFTLPLILLCFKMFPIRWHRQLEHVFGCIKIFLLSSLALTSLGMMMIWDYSTIPSNSGKKNPQLRSLVPVHGADGDIPNSYTGNFWACTVLVLAVVAAIGWDTVLVTAAEVPPNQRGTSISTKALDEAIEDDQTNFSSSYLEVLWKMQVVSFLAAVTSHAIPLGTWVTPLRFWLLLSLVILTWPFAVAIWIRNLSIRVATDNLKPPFTVRKIFQVAMLWLRLLNATLLHLSSILNYARKTKPKKPAEIHHLSNGRNVNILGNYQNRPQMNNYRVICLMVSILGFCWLGESVHALCPYYFTIIFISVLAACYSIQRRLRVGLWTDYGGNKPSSILHVCLDEDSAGSGNQDAGLRNWREFMSWEKVKALGKWIWIFIK